MALFMENKKNRILFIDYFKAFLMCFVILGHINYANEGIKAWIYSFHMPAFFFASGLMINFSSPFDTSKTFQKYLYKLVLPYFLWALIFAKLIFPNLAKILYGSYRYIADAGALTSLWFLPVMFVSIIFFFFFTKMFKQHFSIWVKSLIAVISFAIGFSLPKMKIGYPWSVNVAFVALGFMLLGNVSRFYLFRFYEYLKSARNWIMPLVLSVIMFLTTIIYKMNIPEYGFILMGDARYGDPLLFLSTSFGGILMMLSFSIFISLITREKNVRSLSFIGQNTLCLFAVQKPIIQFYRYFFNYINLPNFVVLLIVLVGTLAVSSLMTLFINRYLPAFVGRKPEKSGS